MHETVFEQSEFDPCRMVSMVSLRRVHLAEFGGLAGVRLVLRHQKSGREFAFVIAQDEDAGVRVVSDYSVLEKSKGLQTAQNSRGQMFWQKYNYPSGWVMARYMFPDEQDAYQAAVVMGADFAFLLSRVDLISH